MAERGTLLARVDFQLVGHEARSIVQMRRMLYNWRATSLPRSLIHVNRSNSREKLWGTFAELLFFARREEDYVDQTFLAFLERSPAITAASSF